MRSKGLSVIWQKALLTLSGSGQSKVLISLVNVTMRQRLYSTLAEPEWIDDIDARFKSTFKKLSEEQKKAVSDDKHVVVQVSGCPGSGKTHSLISRVGLLLDKEKDKSRICVLTFTIRAADEIGKRIEEELGASAPHVQVHTFHSLAKWFLDESGSLKGLLPNLDKVNEYFLEPSEELDLLKSVLLEHDTKLSHPKTLEDSPSSSSSSSPSSSSPSSSSPSSSSPSSSSPSSSLSPSSPSSPSSSSSSSSSSAPSSTMPSSSPSDSSSQEWTTESRWKGCQLLPHAESILEAFSIIKNTRNVYGATEEQLYPVFLQSMNVYKLEPLTSIVSNKADVDLFVPIMADFESRKRDNSKLSLDDLVGAVTHVLMNNPSDEVKKFVSDNFKHFIVDEMQDTNVPQVNLLEALLKVNGSLFVVGDANQAIYQWRGALSSMLNVHNLSMEGNSIRLLSRDLSIIKSRPAKVEPKIDIDDNLSDEEYLRQLSILRSSTPSSSSTLGTAEEHKEPVFAIEYNIQHSFRSHTSIRRIAESIINIDCRLNKRSLTFLYDGHNNLPSKEALLRLIMERGRMNEGDVWGKEGEKGGIDINVMQEASLIKEWMLSSAVTSDGVLLNTPNIREVEKESEGKMNQEIKEKMDKEENEGMRMKKSMDKTLKEKKPADEGKGVIPYHDVNLNLIDWDMDKIKVLQQSFPFSQVLPSINQTKLPLQSFKPLTMLNLVSLQKESSNTHSSFPSVTFPLPSKEKSHLGEPISSSENVWRSPLQCTSPMPRLSFLTPSVLRKEESLLRTWTLLQGCFEKLKDEHGNTTEFQEPYSAHQLKVIEELQQVSNVRLDELRQLSFKHLDPLIMEKKGKDGNEVFTLDLNIVKNVLDLKLKTPIFNTSLYKSLYSASMQEDSVLRQEDSVKEKLKVTKWKRYGVTLASETTHHAEANRIADLIAEELKNGRQPKDIAVLFRKNMEISYVEEALLAKGIPYSVHPGTVPFWSNKCLDEILAIFRVASSPHTAKGEDIKAMFTAIPKTYPKGLKDAFINMMSQDFLINDTLNKVSCDNNHISSSSPNEPSIHNNPPYPSSSSLSLDTAVTTQNISKFTVVPAGAVLFGDIPDWRFWMQYAAHIDNPNDLGWLKTKLLFDGTAERDNVDKEVQSLLSSPVLSSFPASASYRIPKGILQDSNFKIKALVKKHYGLYLDPINVIEQDSNHPWNYSSKHLVTSHENLRRLLFPKPQASLPKDDVITVVIPSDELLEEQRKYEEDKLKEKKQNEEQELYDFDTASKAYYKIKGPLAVPDILKHKPYEILNFLWRLPIDIRLTPPPNSPNLPFLNIYKGLGVQKKGDAWDNSVGSHAYQLSKHEEHFWRDALTWIRDIPAAIQLLGSRRVSMPSLITALERLVDFQSSIDNRYINDERLKSYQMVLKQLLNLARQFWEERFILRGVHRDLHHAAVKVRGETANMTLTMRRPIKIEELVSKGEETEESKRRRKELEKKIEEMKIKQIHYWKDIKTRGQMVREERVEGAADLEEFVRRCTAIVERAKMLNIQEEEPVHSSLRKENAPKDKKEGKDDPASSVLPSPHAVKGGSVTLSTIHAVKGLEFPVVFIAGASRHKTVDAAGSPVFNTREYLDEQRLYFVAATRAKERLFIFWPICPQWLQFKAASGDPFVSDTSRKWRAKVALKTSLPSTVFSVMAKHLLFFNLLRPEIYEGDKDQEVEEIEMEETEKGGGIKEKVVNAEIGSKSERRDKNDDKAKKEIDISSQILYDIFPYATYTDYSESLPLDILTRFQRPVSEINSFYSFDRNWFKKHNENDVLTVIKGKEEDETLQKGKEEGKREMQVKKESSEEAKEEAKKLEGQNNNNALMKYNFATLIDRLLIQEKIMIAIWLGAYHISKEEKK